MRSSYSSPSAFMRATASPRALKRCAEMICRGSSSTDSMTDTTSSACVGLAGSSRSSAASANGASGWLSANSAWRSMVTRTVRPCSSATSSSSTTPASRRDASISAARAVWRARSASGS